MQDGIKQKKNGSNNRFRFDLPFWFNKDLRSSIVFCKTIFNININSVMPELKNSSPSEPLLMVNVTLT